MARGGVSVGGGWVVGWGAFAIFFFLPISLPFSLSPSTSLSHAHSRAPSRSLALPLSLFPPALLSQKSHDGDPAIHLRLRAIFILFLIYFLFFLLLLLLLFLLLLILVQSITVATITRRVTSSLHLPPGCGCQRRWMKTFVGAPGVSALTPALPDVIRAKRRRLQPPCLAASKANRST